MSSFEDEHLFKTSSSEVKSFVCPILFWLADHSEANSICFLYPLTCRHCFLSIEDKNGNHPLRTKIVIF